MRKARCLKAGLKSTISAARALWGPAAQRCHGRLEHASLVCGALCAALQAVPVDVT
jgi:hypothetical protein